MSDHRSCAEIPLSIEAIITLTYYLYSKTRFSPIKKSRFPSPLTAPTCFRTMPRSRQTAKTSLQDSLISAKTSDAIVSANKNQRNLIRSFFVFIKNRALLCLFAAEIGVFCLFFACSLNVDFFTKSSKYENFSYNLPFFVRFYNQISVLYFILTKTRFLFVIYPEILVRFTQKKQPFFSTRNFRIVRRFFVFCSF